MEKRIGISLLLDCYGNLLTDKQRDIMDLYYNKDLSLKELSEITNTSRQAIHDITKRCDKLLFEYEEKLELLKKNTQKKKKIDKIINDLESIIYETKGIRNKEILCVIKNDIENI